MRRPSDEASAEVEARAFAIAGRLSSEVVPIDRETPRGRRRKRAHRQPITRKTRQNELPANEIEKVQPNVRSSPMQRYPASSARLDTQVVDAQTTRNETEAPPAIEVESRGSRTFSQ
jgi:hypothetical protein